MSDESWSFDAGLPFNIGIRSYLYDYSLRLASHNVCNRSVAGASESEAIVAELHDQPGVHGMVLYFGLFGN